MIAALFEALTHALESTPLVALSAACAWGVVSILLSPCHLASIPLIVGFIDEQGAISTKRAFVISLFFSIGILVMIAVIGVMTGLMGKMLGDIGVGGKYVVAIIFFLVGIHLIGLIPFSMFGDRVPPVIQKKGLLAAFLLGLIFGIALGPCTFAFMAPVLAITFSVASTQLTYGIALLCAYGVGHCAVIVTAGTCTRVVEQYLAWTAASKGAVILKKICGVLMLVAGVYVLIGTP